MNVIVDKNEKRVKVCVRYLYLPPLSEYVNHLSKRLNKLE